MKKVYQRIVDPGRGDCMQAAIASLFGEEYENVPPFIEFGQEWWNKFVEFFESKGYKETTYLYNPTIWPQTLPEYSLERLRDFKGIEGLFYAIVCSPKYNPNGELSGITHAVLIDHDFNVVHDPNPLNVGIKYPLHDDVYKGIRQVEIFEKIK